MITRSKPPAPWLFVLSSIFAVLLLLGCGNQTPTPVPVAVVQPPASHEELARHYAPVIRQGAASDQDYVTAADFDGDWIGNNNWENQPTGDLSAYVYYSVIETGSHWFLFYSLFHPRDYTREPCEQSNGCHENDMESLMVVVGKDGTSFGQPQALLTLAHSNIHLYGFDGLIEEGALWLEGAVTREDDHPVVWVETYGHGIYGKRKILVPGKVVYRVGDSAEIPEGIKDEEVRYRLVPIYDSLWQHRDDIGSGRVFDKAFDYSGHTLPASFDGEDWGEDKANPPWGYNQEIGDALLRGDWFLDPAKALTYFASFDGNFSTEYVHNPYLVDLGLLEAP